VKVPTNPAARLEFYTDLVRKCTASQQSRRAFYTLARSYYLFGMSEYGTTDATRYNKTGPHLDQLSSFMFAPDTTRFNIELGPSVADEPYGAWVNPMVDSLKQVWEGGVNLGVDNTFKLAVDWGNVYGAMLIKLCPKVHKTMDGKSSFELRHYLVEPGNFGVLREDRPGIYRQEAFCETYVITKSQLLGELRAAAHKGLKEIETLLQAGAIGSDGIGAGATIDNLIVTSIQGGSVSGVANMLSTPLSTVYRPAVAEDLVRMTELYVFDDDLGDWRVITIADVDIPIWDQPLSKVFVAKTIPYIPVIPRPAYDYFFGYSTCEPLMPLQDMRTERIEDIRHLLKKQAHAPTAMTGVSGIPDEMRLALDTPSGILALGDQGATIKQEQPVIPADLWNDVAEIDAMFNEASGIPQIAEGKNPKGVRSEKQAAELAELGSARPKTKALEVEKPLNALATTIVRVLRSYDTRPLRADREEDAEVFFAHQFPDDFVAKVDGHSSSPLFLNAFEAKIFTLLKLKVIDKEDALELLDIPRKKQLIKTLKTKIEPAEAQAHQEAVQLKVAQIRSKRSRGQKPAA
jgi:hypothetical protein